MAGILVNNILPQPPILRSVSSSRRSSIRTLVMVKASSEPSESISVSTKTSDDTGAVVFTAPPGFKPPEPKRFAVKSGKLFDVLGAAIGLFFRFGTGVFVSG